MNWESESLWDELVCNIIIGNLAYLNINRHIIYSTLQVCAMFCILWMPTVVYTTLTITACIKVWQQWERGERKTRHYWGQNRLFVPILLTHNHSNLNSHQLDTTSVCKVGINNLTVQMICGFLKGSVDLFWQPLQGFRRSTVKDLQAWGLVAKGKHPWVAQGASQSNPDMSCVDRYLWVVNAVCCYNIT